MSLCTPENSTIQKLSIIIIINILSAKTNTYSFAHLSSWMSMCLLVSRGHKPRELPLKYTQSSSPSTMLRSADKMHTRYTLVINILHLQYTALKLTWSTSWVSCIHHIHRSASCFWWFHFLPFNCCLSVVLSLDKGAYPENSHVVSY